MRTNNNEVVVTVAGNNTVATEYSARAMIEQVYLSIVRINALEDSLVGLA
jgi:hypothetical protein